MLTYTKKSINNFVYGLLLCFFLFFSLFVGDASIYGVRLFYFIVLLYILLISISNIVVKNNLLNVHIYFLLLIFIIPQAIFIRAPDLYATWPINTLLLYLILALIYENIKLFQTNKPLNNGYFVGGLLLLIIFFIGITISNGSRGSFIFGPNVLYRIFTILGILTLLPIRTSPQKTKLFATLIVLGIVVFALYKTGSRGAIPTALIFLFFCYHFLFNKFLPIKFLLLASLIGLLLLPLLSGIEQSRFLNFDIKNNESLSLRLNMWFALFANWNEWLISMGHIYSDFMSNFWEPNFPYPHNIFLELIYYFGFLGGFLTFLIIYNTFKLLMAIMRSNQSWSYISFCYIFFILLTGSQFSGNLMDNFSVIATLILLVHVREKNDKIY